MTLLGFEPVPDATAYLGRYLGRADVEVAREEAVCPMTHEAHQDLPHSPRILRALARAHDMRLDAPATVARPGRVRLGDTVELL
ncbi:hypothetical protein ACFXN2_25495 [Streptomyces kronopolitis]|uniref:hypothetical protein n=1 Tax=Streptomyces kronopolitis TaxID=1612435 RepID=UPI0036D1F610